MVSFYNFGHLQRLKFVIMSTYTSTLWKHLRLNILIHQDPQTGYQAANNYQYYLLYVQVPIQVTYKGHTQVFSRRAH